MVDAVNSRSAPIEPADGFPPTRRDRSWRDWYLVAVVVGFVATVLGPSLIGLRTMLAVNSITNYYPWVAAHGSDAVGHEACSGDTFDTEMPQVAHIRAAIFSGHLGSWQGIVAGGGPLASVPDVGLLDPLSLPYWILPLWLAPAFVLLLEFVVGIGGAFLFLRRLGVSRAASTLAGLIFVTSGFMVMWSNWPQTRVAALIPALFWAVERLIQRLRITDAVLVAVVIASMVFGGFPAVTGYTLYLVAGYFLVRTIALHRSNLRRCGWAVILGGGGLALGALITTVQLLPFLSFYQEQGLGYRQAAGIEGLPFSGLLTVIAPNAYGLCIRGQATRGAVNPIELIAYLGSAAVVLAIAGAAFGLMRRRSAGRGVQGYFVAAAIVMIGVIWVSPHSRQILAHLPVFNNNFIGRARSVFGFSLAILAALGFDWLTLERHNPPDPLLGETLGHPRVWTRLWQILVWLGALSFGGLVLWRANRNAVAAHYWSEVLHASWIPGLLVLATLSIVALVVISGRLHRPNIRVAAFVLVPLLVAAQAGQFYHSVLPGDSPSDFYPNTGTHKFLESHLGEDRFASSGGTMYPATALYYGLRTPTGHSFTNTAWSALLTKMDPKVMLTATFSQFSAALDQTNIADQPILDRMAVKYFVLSPVGLTGKIAPLPASNGAVDVGNGAATCTMPAQALRGVTVKLATALVATSPSDGATLDVTVRDGNQTVSSGQYMSAASAAGSAVSVALAGEQLPSGGTATVTVRAVNSQGLSLAAENGAVVCAPVTPLPDGLKLVYADSGSIIYQRLSALPRIRWASATQVIPNEVARVTAISKGVAADEVVLNSPGAPASGQPAQVTVGSDNDDDISATVTARGAGYLVVADALQQKGWGVTVDGKSAKLVPADNAMVAVAIPAGVHTVKLQYQAPGQREGLVLSVAAVIVAVALVWWDRRRHRRTPLHSSGRRRPAAPAASLAEPPLAEPPLAEPPLGEPSAEPPLSEPSIQGQPAAR